MDKRAATKLWRRAIDHLERIQPEVLAWARATGADTFRRLKSKEFLRQYCFVVYASGFRYATIKAKFPALTDAFCRFDLDKLSAMQSPDRAMAVFANRRKASNFLNGAQAIAAEGFSAFKRRLAARGADMLVELPGIGHTTKEHLAKNIGLSDVAKPDVWLVRAANVVGARDVHSLVEYLYHKVGESRHVIDVAIWTLGRDGLLYDEGSER